MSARRETKGTARIAVTLAAVVVVAAGAAGLWFMNGGSAQSTPTNGDIPRYKVRRGDIRITLPLVGTFEAEEAIKVRADIRGNAKIVSIVDEGTIVKKGDILVELDKTDAEREVQDLEARRDKAKANLTAAETDEEITRLESESRIFKAGMDVDMAELELKKFIEGSRPKEVRDADIRIAQAEVKVSRLEANDARMPEMLRQGFVTKEEVKQSELDLQTARNELETAKLEKKILVDYTHPMRHEQLLANIRQAKAELERLKQIDKRRGIQTRAATTQCKQDLARAEQQLAEAREWLAKMTIRAESDGIVVYGSGSGRWWDPEEIKVGANVVRYQVLMRLPNLNTMQLLVKVHEADINKIRVDKQNPQPVLIRMDSRPGRTFSGHVHKIETIAQAERNRQNIKRFSTTISLEKQIPGIRPGMTATADILVGEVSNVLYVPIQAVQTYRGETFCHMADTRKPRKVEIGASNDNFVEIKSGLEAGEEVMLAPPKLDPQDADERAEKGPKTRRPGRSGTGTGAPAKGKEAR